ncbi:flavin monoamine oxidase family protein [Ruegeria arenilitoris]|uniref:flavin monoamine oxidase family protein n=1 Tax=Ruegeria arenilitoris TaxID=1173585 RepID=UPI00147BDBD1|nr:FAD-dependent oxidoreductase [Ruegeria arenilitoris]
MKPDVEIAIVGAGLSGLALAHMLKPEGRDVLLLETRDRAGGRVLSQDGYDLGPSWIWPHNHRMLALLNKLGLRVFPQHSDGRLVFEDAQGNVRRDLDLATMGGALRVAGGLAQITDALAQRLGDKLRLEHPVRRVIEEDGCVTLSGDGFSLRADRVVLALPPRLAAQMGVVVPDVPTWMAGHTKFLAVYNTPFWRGAGLNGDAISHQGPLAEIHDASPLDGTEGALFGFAVPGAARQSGFEALAVTQLGRLFGPEAADPRAVFFKDWSADTATATSADLKPPTSHPEYGALTPSQRVIFAGTETAPSHGGFLEGALEAVDTAHRELSRTMA